MADPQKFTANDCYSPLISDPVYGYQAVNVESNERYPSSLLNWIKRVIKARREFVAFGLGELQLFETQSRSVLAFSRSWQNQTILVVANLSRFVKSATIPLEKFGGASLVEVFGKTQFPTITQEPYFLSLGPHAFYWFEVKR